MMSRGGPDDVAALRTYLASHPEDDGARLRLAQLLLARGERAAARVVVAPLDRDDAPADAVALLAVADEEDGLLASAEARWQRLLADDIDHPEARARTDRLRAARGGEAQPPVSLAGAAPTLASPEGVSALRYRIERELGRGATSTVYLAQDESLGIPLALKILHPHLAASERSEACRRFFAEARVVAALRHPGVVAIYDLDETARALAMEYLPGGTLRDRLRAGALAPAEAAATTETILGALSYVHARGIVHGDITPRNILLRAPGAAVLADFGNARLVAPDAAHDVPTAGTPLYLAPEQFRGAPPAAATDLFAVGALAWEMLAGRPMRDHAALMADRLTPPSLPPDAAERAGAGLAALVAALTAPDPRARPATAADALAALG